MAINKFLGNFDHKRLENLTFHNNEEIRQRLAPTRTEGSGEWVDLSGLIVPQQGIIRLIRRIENGEIESVGQITDTFRQLHADYYQLEWTWAWEVMQPWYRVTPESITAGDVIRIVNTWKEAVVNLDKMLYEDAKKEFSRQLKPVSEPTVIKNKRRSISNRYGELLKIILSWKPSRNT